MVMLTKTQQLWSQNNNGHWRSHFQFYALKKRWHCKIQMLALGFLLFENISQCFLKCWMVIIKSNVNLILFLIVNRTRVRVVDKADTEGSFMISKCFLNQFAALSVQKEIDWPCFLSRFCRDNVWIFDLEKAPRIRGHIIFLVCCPRKIGWTTKFTTCGQWNAIIAKYLVRFGAYSIRR